MGLVMISMGGGWSSEGSGEPLPCRFRGTPASVPPRIRFIQGPSPIVVSFHSVGFLQDRAPNPAPTLLTFSSGLGTDKDSETIVGGNSLVPLLEEGNHPSLPL